MRRRLVTDTVGFAGLYGVVGLAIRLALRETLDGWLLLEALTYAVFAVPLVIKQRRQHREDAYHRALVSSWRRERLAAREQRGLGQGKK